MSLFVVVFSACVQLTAVVCALLLIRVTGRLVAWLCIAFALALMAARRLMGIAEAMAAPSEGYFLYELVGLSASMLMLAGTVLIRRYFLQHRVMEQTLRDRGENYRIIADHTADWECWRALDGTLLYISPSCEELTGYAPSAFYGDPRLISRIIHPDDSKPDTPHCCRRPGCKDETVTSQYRIIRRDGEVRWMSGHCRPVLGEAGQITGWRGSIRDVTDTVLSEMRQAMLISELQDALGRVKTLAGLVPICSGCKKIRDDQGFWTRVEVYLQNHTEAQFSHGLCPECVCRLYPEEAEALGFGKPAKSGEQDLEADLVPEGSP